MNCFLATLLRDLRRFQLEPLRIPARLIQPMLYLVLLGAGHGGSSVLGPRGYPLYIFPGVVALSILTTSGFSGTNILLDRERGFLKAILVAPVSRFSIAFAKVVSGALIAVAQALPLLIVAPFIGIVLGPLEILLFLLAMLICAAALSAVCVALSCRLSLTNGFQVVFNAVMMPMYFVSGALFPLQSAPRWLRTLAWFDPMAYGVDLMRSALNGGAYFQPLLAIGLLAGSTVLLTWSAALAFEQGEDE